MCHEWQFCKYLENLVKRSVQARKTEYCDWLMNETVNKLMHT